MVENLFILKKLHAMQRTENPNQIFPEKELRGHSPNFHIHVSVSDLYIPTINLPILLQEICGLILGILCVKTVPVLIIWTELHCFCPVKILESMCSENVILTRSRLLNKQLYYFFGWGGGGAVERVIFCYFSNKTCKIPSPPLSGG